MKFSPWDFARRTKRNKSGSVEQYVTPAGTVDVFDPSKSDGTDIPDWALCWEIPLVQAQHPDWTLEQIKEGARELFLANRKGGK